MNDDELNENLALLIEDYVGRDVDFLNEVQLFNDGGLSRIIVWNVDGVPQPDIESFRGKTLKPLKDKQKREKKKKEGSRFKIPTLSQDLIDELVPDVGTMVLNSDTDAVQVFVSSGWATLATS